MTDTSTGEAAAGAAGQVPDCDALEAAAFVRNTWGIDGVISELPGERDRNFLLTTTSNRRYVFKIANPLEQEAFLLAQHDAFNAVAKMPGLHGIGTILTLDGAPLGLYRDTVGNALRCRLATWLDGALLSEVVPRGPGLYRSLGAVVAKTGEAIAGVDLAALERPLLWDIREASTIVERFGKSVAGSDRRQLLEKQVERALAMIEPVAANLPTGVIHNDVNDNNVVVDWQSPWAPVVNGLIDFGDMVWGWRVADLGIAVAYAMLDQRYPLDAMTAITGGYHAQRQLSETELRVVLPLAILRLCMSVSIAAHQQSLQPDNRYLGVSEAPAWALLERLLEVPPRYAEFLLRAECGYEPISGSAGVHRWLADLRGNPESVGQVVDLDLQSAPLAILDTSVSSPDYLPAELQDAAGRRDPEGMQRWITRTIKDAGAVAGIGRYDEYRLIYGGDAFTDFSGHTRTLHTGIDIYQRAGSPVNAVLNGVVHSVADHAGDLDYGGTVILRHALPERYKGSHTSLQADSIFTLYGHLDPGSLDGLHPGQSVTAGQRLATMGDARVNGGWPPHLHFQIMLDMLDETDQFFGVGSHAHRHIWQAICPDPNLLLGIPEDLVQTPLSDSERQQEPLVSSRNRVVSAALSLAYRQPIMTARGVRQYLYDVTGRRYLDAVNNVPHVGHCHPHVTRAGHNAARTLGTNTRYLYPGLTRYAERLLGYLPDALEVVFMVNSGSEANDLALRLARQYTQRQQVIVLDHAYHGNLSTLIDLSPYKHNGRGGGGPPEWVHSVPLPISGQAAEIKNLAERVDDIAATAGLPAAVFAEPISGCGGQVVLPDGYLSALFERVKHHGGLCVADEVQTGFGRVGSHFWGFETQGVLPDIVTMGKPAGNGHPIGIVATTRAVADCFANGMEYFNTFGGNSVSCAIGEAVLDVIEDEGLQSHAWDVGSYLMEALGGLAERHDIVTDVRGSGLFLGVELREPDGSAAGDQAGYVVERMKQEGVLISSDGPDNNVLKIKPPMVFDRINADTLCVILDSVLRERWAQGN